MNATDFAYLVKYLKHSSSVHAHLVIDEERSCVLVMNNKGSYEFFNGSLWRVIPSKDAYLLVNKCPASDTKTAFILATQIEQLSY